MMHGGGFRRRQTRQAVGARPERTARPPDRGALQGAPPRCGDDCLPGDHHRGRRRGEPGAHRCGLRRRPLPHHRNGPVLLPVNLPLLGDPGRDHDRNHDRHRGDRRAPDLRHQPRGTARHGGASQPSLRAPPGHVAALLHRHANRRDSVPAHQRRRRHSVGRHRHGDIAPVQHRDAAQHVDRDAVPLLAADGALAWRSPRSSSSTRTEPARSGVRSRCRRRNPRRRSARSPRRRCRSRACSSPRSSGAARRRSSVSARRITGSPTWPSVRR